MRKWPHHANNSTCNQASTRSIHGSPGCHSHNHFRLSTVRFIISNCELSRISIFVGGNISNCSPVRTPPGSPFHECYRVEMVLEGTSMPSGLLFRSYLLPIMRCTSYERAPSWSFPIPLGGWVLREASQLIS